MVNMNVYDPSTLTEANVVELLASKDDSEHRQLRVLNDGSVILSDEVGNLNLEGVKCRWETWCSGNGYVGEAASKDERWVEIVLFDLRRVDAEGLAGFIED